MRVTALFFGALLAIHAAPPAQKSQPKDRSKSVEIDKAEEGAFAAVAEMAWALSDSDLDSFLSPISRDLKDYEKLRENVRAMLALYEVSSSVTAPRNEGDDKRRELELDWLLSLKSRGDYVRLERRQERVRVTVEKQGKRWKVTSIDPLDFFRAPSS